MLFQRCSGWDDVVHLAPHLPLELGDVARVAGIPQRQRHLTGVSARIGIVLPQLLLRRRLVVVRQVAQEEERQHVVPEIVRIHRPPQLVGDAPEGVAQLALVGVGHFEIPGVGAGVGAVGVAGGNHSGLKGKLRRNSSKIVRKADRTASSILGLSNITQSPWLFKSRIRF